MEFIASAVLLLVGTLLTTVTLNIVQRYRQGDILIGKATVAFIVALTVAYYLSLLVLLV